MTVSGLTVVRYELAIFAVGVVVIVLYRLLTGAINLEGLLDDKATQSFSAERFQLLFISLGGAACYIIACYQAQAFVPVPGDLQALLGGSNALYVVRKYLACLAG